MQTTQSLSRESGGREAVEHTILNAAECVFARHGYRGASLQAIADRAGLPKANVLYYMGSKQVLYLKLLDRMMRRWNAVLDDITTQSDPREVLSDFIRTKMMLGQRYPDGSKLFAAEILAGAPFLADYLEGELRQWVESRVDVMRHWIEQGKMDSVDPRFLIFLIWSSTQHYVEYGAQVNAILGQEGLSEQDIDDVTAFLERVILKGCGVR
ncbi:TetR/AcrR family transcriptional regulator [Vreelandella malpeensis]|uniref:TetR family transcriptional regulator C-terminal domain-containing protein n=1 Tax=Vreelandella malpeensis TaxID=1172368 RepID=A0ABS8DUV8_9GAMM|nr:TetR/AcrR family transcriptional regulator [Halomonas malpeensis]MCB8890118.1 TetR family transcriptional regulator C-terminal domain-containing protein [Halomonas malpeensis]